MWNILIVLIIAVIVLMFNPFSSLNTKNPMGSVPKKTRDEVNQVESEAVRQVNKARQIQQQEQENLQENN